mgnify:CR=1 FL=1
MITLSFDRNLCLCCSYFEPETKTVNIGTRYCFQRKRACFPKHLSATIAHEIGHALLKHGGFSYNLNPIQAEAEAWAFAATRAKVSKSLIHKCLMSHGIAFGETTLSKVACKLLGA